jgi:hypothetical protein
MRSSPALFLLDAMRVEVADATSTGAPRPSMTRGVTCAIDRPSSVRGPINICSTIRSAGSAQEDASGGWLAGLSLQGAQIGVLILRLVGSP